MNLKQAIQNMAKGTNQGKAVERIITELELDAHDWQEWLENGDWSGNETRESLLEEIADIQEQLDYDASLVEN